MRRAILCPATIALATVLAFTSVFSVSTVSAANGEVRLRGKVLTNEEWGETAYYGSYYCTVLVYEIMSDPEGLLAMYSPVPVCYSYRGSPLGLVAGELVECCGYYFHDSGPMEGVGWVVCKDGVDYHVVRALPVGDIDHDLDVDIFDLVQCANAYGSVRSDLNWNIYCDIRRPYWAVDIFDLVMIASSYGEEYTP